MENLIVEEICKNLKWYEKIIVKVFKNTFIKTWHRTREDIVNLFIK